MTRRKRFVLTVTPLEGRALLAPVIAPQGDVYGEENQTLSVQIQASDPGPVTFSLGSGAPGGMTIDAASGLLKWTPPFVSQTIPVTVFATAADGSSSVRFNVLVFDVPPSVNGEINSVVVVGQTFSGGGSFASPDAGSFQATIGFGDGPRIDPLPLTGDAFSFSHVYQTAGTYVVSIRVIDPQGYSGFGYFSVTVLPIVSSAPTSMPPPLPTPTPTPAPPVVPVPVPPVPASVVVIAPPGSTVTVTTPKHARHPVPKHRPVHKLTPLQAFLNAHRVSSP